MTLLYMRWPGRVLGADETPPASVLSFVARQLDVPEAAWRDYGRRDPTRRAHLADLARRMGYRAFGRTDFHALAAFAMKCVARGNRQISPSTTRLGSV